MAWPEGQRPAGSALQCAALNAGGREPSQDSGLAWLVEERHLVVEGRQADVGDRPEGRNLPARGLGVGPETRAVVRVERQPAAALAVAAEEVGERGAGFGGEDGESDAGEVDEVEAVEVARIYLGGRQEEGAGGGAVAPVGEAALALGVEADGVEPGHAVGAALDQAGVEALGFEEGDHPCGERVGAEGGDVGDGDLGGGALEVDGGVEGVAGEADPAAVAFLARQGQLDHAFPDAGDAHGPSPVCLVPTEQHAGRGDKRKFAGGSVTANDRRRGP